MPRKTRKEIEEEEKRERNSRSRHYIPARSHVHHKDWAGKDQRKIEEEEKEDSPVNGYNCRSP